MKIIDKILLCTIAIACILIVSCKEEELPAISKTIVKSTGPNFAVIQGRIYVEGSSAIQRTGACWMLKSVKEVNEDLLEYPTLDDFSQESDMREVGIINMRVVDLQPDTVYFVRLFAQNKEGVFYSYPTRVTTWSIPEGGIFIEGGTFMMGNNEGLIDELPQHKVKLGNFFLSQKEITNDEYVKFLNKEEIGLDGKVKDVLYIDLTAPGVQITQSNGKFVSKSGAGNKPVVCVTWEGAQAFCEWRGGKLPTEAEWEFAARGGLLSEENKYAGSNDYLTVGWFADNSGRAIQEVGKKAPNELNLFDMSGNVAEWCRDWYNELYYGKSNEENPEGPSSGTEKVVRGGSFDSAPSQISTRGYKNPKEVAGNIGFRVRF